MVHNKNKSCLFTASLSILIGEDSISLMVLNGSEKNE